MSRSRPVTPATRALDALGLPWTPHAYEHDPREAAYGPEAVRALGLPAARVLKTLVVSADGALAVAVIPVPTSLDLRALAAALGAKRSAMADPDLAERRTGYVVGGISPLGQRSRLPLVLDTGAAAHTTVFVSGGRRGFEIELAPADLLAATGGTTAAVAVAR